MAQSVGENACCTLMKIWVRIPRTHIMLDWITHICNPSIPTARGESENGESGSSWAN